MSDSDRFDKFETFRAEAAAKLKLSVDHDRVRLLAGLKLNFESLLERMIRGDNVPPDHVKTLSDTIQEMLPPDLPNLNLKWVSSVVGVYDCKFCGARNELPEGDFTPPPKHQDPARTIDVVPNKEPASASPRPAANPPAPAPHEVMLKRLPGSDGDWKRHVASNGTDPFSPERDPHPYKNRNGHALPDSGSLVWFGK